MLELEHVKNKDTVQEVTIRWDCSPYDLAGWAIAGKLDIVTAIEPIEQGGEVLAGLVVVPVADILSMFRRWESWERRRKGPACVRAGRKIFYRMSVVQDWLRSQEMPRVAETKPSKARGRK